MLQMVKRLFSIAICLAAMSGCNQLDLAGLVMPTGDGVEKRFEHSQSMQADLKVGVVDASANYMFYVCTDPHINATYKNLDIFNNSLRNDSEASFGVILGDCTDTRSNLHTYMSVVRYDATKHRYDYNIFHVLGNHDLFFNGWCDFRELVGPSVFWFEVVFPEGKDLYISLDTATGTLGYKQTQWFKSFLADNRHKYRHCIILTHTNFFYTDRTQSSSGNMPLEESLALIDFLGEHNVSLVLQGHDHYREDLTYDDVRYTVIGAISDEIEAPEYLKVYVGSDKVDLDWQLITDDAEIN